MPGTIRAHSPAPWGPYLGSVFQSILQYRQAGAHTNRHWREYRCPWPFAGSSLSTADFQRLEAQFTAFVVGAGENHPALVAPGTCSSKAWAVYCVANRTLERAELLSEPLVAGNSANQIPDFLAQCDMLSASRSPVADSRQGPRGRGIEAAPGTSPMFIGRLLPSRDIERRWVVGGCVSVHRLMNLHEVH